MRKGIKIKKSSVAIVAALSVMVGSFATATAANYQFTVVNNAMSTNAAGGSVMKNSASNFGKIVVTSYSSNAAGYSVSYRFYSDNTPVTSASDVKNAVNTMGYPLYNSGYTGSGFHVSIKATGGSATPPNYSTVSGTWSPTY